MAGGNAVHGRPPRSAYEHQLPSRRRAAAGCTSCHAPAAAATGRHPVTATATAGCASIGRPGVVPRRMCCCVLPMVAGVTCLSQSPPPCTFLSMCSCARITFSSNPHRIFLMDMACRRVGAKKRSSRSTADCVEICLPSPVRVLMPAGLADSSGSHIIGASCSFVWDGARSTGAVLRSEPRLQMTWNGASPKLM